MGATREPPASPPQQDGAEAAQAQQYGQEPPQHPLLVVQGTAELQKDWIGAAVVRQPEGQQPYAGGRPPRG